MHVIEVSNITKYYGKNLGVKDISFSVDQGEVFGFLGPNGAGKTTTIRLLLQLLRADSGVIEIFGKSKQKELIGIRERIGYLPGDFQPYSYLTVSDFLNYIARYRSRPALLRNSLLERFQLNGHDQRKRLKHLSHGNRQKVGLIMALEHDPDLLILDEPTIGLDPLMQEAFYQVILDFQRRGKTVFLSSHILSEVEKICQRVAIIRQGKLVAVESLQNLRMKRRRRLIVEFKDLSAEQLPPQLPELRLLTQKNGRCEYVLEGDWQRALKALAELPLTDLVIPEPELEDIFLAYYQESRHD